MNLLSPLEKQAIIGDFLGEGMLEDVFQFRKKTLLVNELQALKIEEMGFEILFHLCDSKKDAKDKVLANDGCHLHGPLQVIFQSIHPGRNYPLDGIRYLNIRSLLA